MKILKVCVVVAVAVAVVPALAGAAQPGPAAPAGLGLGGHAWAADVANAVADHAVGKTMPRAAATHRAPQLTGQVFGSGSVPTTYVGDTPGAPGCGRDGLATPYPGDRGASGAASPVGDACDPRGLWPVSAEPLQGQRSCCDGSGTEFTLMPGLVRYFSAQDAAQHLTAQVEALPAVLAQPGEVAAAEPEPPSLALMLLTLGAALLASKVRPRSRYGRF